MATETTIKLILSQMQSTYPQQSVNASALALLTATWAQVLADVPDALLDAAAADYLRSDAAFRPAPGQLRSLAMRISDGDANERAMQAWQAILESDFGRDLDGVDDTARTVMLRIGGFEGYANSKVEDAHYWRDRFIKLYSDISERQQGRLLIESGDTLRLVTQTANKLRLEGQRK